MRRRSSKPAVEARSAKMAGPIRAGFSRTTRAAAVTFLLISFITPGDQFTRTCEGRVQVASFAANVVLTMKAGRKARNRINLELKFLRVTEVDTQASPEFQAFVEHLRHDINSDAVKGRVTMRLPPNNTSIQNGNDLSTTVRLDFGRNNRAGLKTNAAGSWAPAMGSGLDCNILFEGKVNSPLGFNLEGISPGPLSSLQLRFEEAIQKAGPGRRRSDRTRFEVRPVSWEVPSVRFGLLEINVKDWGKTPSALRNLDKHQVRVDMALVQYDAGSETITGRLTFAISKVEENE